MGLTWVFFELIETLTSLDQIPKKSQRYFWVPQFSSVHLKKALEKGTVYNGFVLSPENQASQFTHTFMAIDSFV